MISSARVRPKMHVLLTRSEESNSRTASLLHESGIATSTLPLFDLIDCAPEELPDLTKCQGILFTSANAVKIFARHFPISDLPVYCVGDHTAIQARSIGFQTVYSANGDMKDLARLIKSNCTPDQGPFLRLAAKLSGDPFIELLKQDNFDVISVTLYEMKQKKVDLLASLQKDLTGICFYSPRTAAYFQKLLTHSGLEEACRPLMAWCISENTARKLDPQCFKTILSADRPTQQSLLTLIRETIPC